MCECVCVCVCVPLSHSLPLCLVTHVILNGSAGCINGVVNETSVSSSSYDNLSSSSYDNGRLAVSTDCK